VQQRDAIIAATARAHQTPTITRNTMDFESTGAAVISPSQ